VSLAAGRYYWEVWAANAHGTATHAVQPRFDVPAFPTLTIGDAEVAEGDGGLSTVVLAATLSSPAAAPVRFHWATRDVSARQGTDYGAASGEVTIAAGESTAALELSVLGDLVYEGDESFEVVLSDVVGAALGDGVGLARILDDDPAPQVRIGDGRVVEGNAPASAKLRFEVTLSGATEVTATVRVVTDGCTASTGTDFTPLDEVVSFAPGEIAKAIEVEVPGDPDFEGDEILFAHLSVPTAATITDAEGLGVVANDDPPVWGGPWPLPPAADFDGDGYGDLAFRNDDSGALVAWLLEGIVRREGAFFSPSAPADGNWMPVALGDFDGDGDADLVFQNIDSGRLSIWHLNELLRVSATLLDGPRDRAWRPVGAADLDGDGHTDLLWQHRGSGALLAWLFDAAGGHREAASSPRTTGDAALEIAALGDVDADGAVDFLLRHAVTGALSAWRMDGLQRIEELPVTPAAVPDLSWRLVAASDVDRSGSLDLVWQHATSRRIVAWLMQGTTRQCGAYTVPDGPAALNWSVFGPR
jgi:hypothetical protein